MSDDLNPNELRWPSLRVMFKFYFQMIWKMGDILVAQCQLCNDSKIFKINLSTSAMAFGRHLKVCVGRKNYVLLKIEMKIITVISADASR